MKLKFALSILASVATVGSATADTATTLPVGYVTEKIKGSNFNLLGLTVHQPIVASGDFEVVAGKVLTDSDVNFTTSLVAGRKYILEIKTTSGPGTGFVQEVGTWTGSALTTDEDISSVVTANVTTYSLRAAATLATTFGENNEAGLFAGTATTADVVWVPNLSGGFDQYYRQAASPPFVPTAQWAKIGSSGNFATAPLVYVDGIFIQRRAAGDLDLVISGEVKKLSTNSALVGGGAFNYIGANYPVGSTLANSGLAQTVLAGTSTTADIVWLPNGAGGYNQFFYQAANPPFVPTAQWVKIGVAGDAGATELTSAVIIQRRGASANAVITPPAAYSNL